MDNLPILPETRVLPRVKLRRDRWLPTRGQVHTTIGSKVDPLDLVARAAPAKEIRAVPLTRVMGLQEADLARHLHKHVGDPLKAREIIISKKLNIFNERLIYRAPAAGRVLALQGSWMLLELDTAPVDLTALYRGVITNVMPREGVTIEAEGAWAQGIWGSGHEGYGVLRLVGAEPGEVLRAERIDPSARGQVMVANTVETAEALQALVKMNAAGLVLGSLPAPLKDVAETLGLPILVTEGFGRVPFSPPLLDLLRRFNGNEVALNAAAASARAVRSTILRPELFIPIVKTAERGPSQPPTPLGAQLGSNLRVTAAPWLGQAGPLAAVPGTGRLFESGARLGGAEIDLPSGRVFVPWPDLELIG